MDIPVRMRQTRMLPSPGEFLQDSNVRPDPLAQWSFALGAGLFVLYYGVCLWLLARWLFHRLSLLLSGSPTPARKLLRQLEEMDLIYPLLVGPTLHIGAVRRAFERASEKGVVWDHRIFHVLDRLADRNPQIWSNYLPTLH
jgi:hypothetical protein